MSDPQPRDDLRAGWAREVGTGSERRSGVDGDNAVGEQLEVAAQADEAAADVANARSNVVTEVGDGS